MNQRYQDNLSYLKKKETSQLIQYQCFNIIIRHRINMNIFIKIIHEYICKYVREYLIIKIGYVHEYVYKNYILICL